MVLWSEAPFTGLEDVDFSPNSFTVIFSPGCQISISCDRVKGSQVKERLGPFHAMRTENFPHL